ncbi:MAG: galactose ABC transporter substrate-binding protein [Spirochaetota bacterium]
MKRSFAFSVLLIAVMLVIGAAAVSAQAAKQVPYVGITIFDYTNTFVGYIRNGINFYMNEKYPSLKFMMVNGENVQATQTERIDTMISRGVNVLAVNPVDTSAGDTIVAKAKQAGIPIVFFNRMPTAEVLNSYDKCWYVGLDALYQGQLEGEMVADAWKKDSAKYDTNRDGVLQYVLMTGTPGHSDATDRANGFYAGIKASGIAAQQIATQPANWNTAKAVETMNSWIGKFGDKIEMVVCSNDAMALGAVEALKANGLITAKKAIPVIGVNALPETAELIKSGVMLGSILTSTYDTARAVIDICMNVVNGKAPDANLEWKMVNKIVKIPEKKITVENVGEAIAGYKLAK